jgi:hypothetical protein
VVGQAQYVVLLFLGAYQVALFLALASFFLLRRGSAGLICLLAGSVRTGLSTYQLGNLKMSYNGWTNKETWLLNVWYMDDMPSYFADSQQYEVDPYELEETIRFITEESEALSQLPSGLLSDFINDAWSEVNWFELSEALNSTLKEYADEAA